MSTMDRDGFDRLLNEVEQMDDEALDAMVARAAADYNAPPAGPVRPPVEAMWARIDAAQRPARHTGLRVQRWQLLAASVAFVAFGITIGRQWSGMVGGSDAHAGAPVRVAHPVAHSSPASASTPSASSGTTTSVAATTPAEPTEAPAHAAGEVASSSHSVMTPRSHAAPRVNGGAASGAAASARSDAAYQIATMRHFAAAEALLASYDGSARDAKTDAQLASWASDLLSQTRLLLDSPAGRDPVRRRLLQDLELVLVQMAQLDPDAPKSAALEHDLIDGSVRHNDIITRLRSAVPAGATTAL